MSWDLIRLQPDQDRPEFDCGDGDLNEFFAKDSKESGKHLLSVTYVAEISGKVGAFFSVSNDSIRRKDAGKSILRRLVKPIPREKRYASLPAVKIGRLATCSGMQCKNVGTELLDYIKYSFTHDNKTGCRFVVVDAYNNPRTINFYTKNGFDFLTSEDEQDETRLMFFDLITFTP